MIYDGPEKLAELEARVCRAHGIGEVDRSRTTYVLDKLLHDGLLPRPQALDGADLTYLFLLRNPRRTLQSLVHQLDSTLDDAFAYYHARLSALETYARIFPRSSFLTYEDLVGEPERTQRTLAGLTAFLELGAPLSQEYQLQPLHDVKGVGDRSEALRAGRILANPRELAVELPEDRLAAAKAAYWRCREVLSSVTLTA